MSPQQTGTTGQLGFDALLQECDADNERKKLDRAHSHLPGTLEEALPFFRALIDRHHAAMLAGDAPTVRQLRGDAHGLALKLNNYDPGILADENASGCVLERLTRAPEGTVPLWGQEGSFTLEHGVCRVRIELEGLFGFGAGCGFWPGFCAHAVDFETPFLSETGFRSFLGVRGTAVAGHTPESFCTAVIDAYVARELKGRLRPIDARYRT